jgi:hypothetical protein
MVAVHLLMILASGAASSFARLPMGKTRCVMAASSSARLPRLWPLLADKLSDEIRPLVESTFISALEEKDKMLEIVLENKDKALEEKDKMLEIALKDKVKTLEDKDKALEDKDKMLEIVLEAKDQLLKAKDKALEDQNKQIIDGDIRYVKAMQEIHVIYELRHTFDWLLRSVYPGDSSRPGSMFNKLMDEITDKDTGNFKAVFKDKYNELSLQFKVGQYEPSSVVAVRGCYKELNNNMHGSKKIDLPGSGIACGGASREQQHLHAFIIAIVQMLCAERSYPLDTALQKIFVLDDTYTKRKGVVAGACFTEYPQS